MVDRELILRKLASLDEYASQAAEFRELTADRYQHDWKTQRIVDRTLQLAIEVCVDIANHIIADRELRVPSTYSEAFEVLTDAKVLEPALGSAMAAMARFRNLRVHGYARLEPARVVTILREHLGDFARFKDAVLRSL
jgi:uncharacterized protein YutE (UPF0331/DUF86 family)